MTETAEVIGNKGPRLAELLAGLVDGPVSDQTIAGLSLDSRSIEPGDWFIALIGASQDGRRFIPDAVRAGAAGVLMEETGDRIARIAGISVPVIPVHQLRQYVGLIAERFYGYPSQGMEIIGVTGTNGKTSVSHFLAQTLSATEFGPAGLVGTLGSGFLGALETAETTTPDPISLHRILRQMRERDAKSAVIEVSSHSLDQHRVSGISFDVAVFTNLSRDHLDYHAGIEEYGRSKLRLFEHADLGVAVINFDDPFSRRILEVLAPEVRVFGYASSSHELDIELAKYPCVNGRVLAETGAGLHMLIDSPFGTREISLPIAGRFNAGNVLATAAALLALDLPFNDVMERLARLRAVPGRFERFGGSGRPLVVVDYAHTPDALEQALLSLRPLCGGRLWCVFGCGGDRDSGKRAEMGRVAEQHADRVIVTSDNPRSEDPAAIAAQIVAECGDKVEVILDRGEAIAMAFSTAAPQDAILVAGKGHEDYQEISGVRRHFSDREQVKLLFDEVGA